MSRTVGGAAAATSGVPAPLPGDERRTPAGSVGVRGAVALWLASRAGLVVTVLGACVLLGVDDRLRRDSPGEWVLQRLVWWDSLHFVRIAELGYLPPGLPCCDQAFFPGYPLLIRLVMPLVGGSAPVASLLVTGLAGVAAAVAVWHLVRDQGGPRAATTAVVLMAVAPYGIFFTAAYTETLFLALAAGAWWAAGRRRWWLAGLLCAGSVSVRVNGLFLLAGLVVLYVGQLRSAGGRRPRADALALLAPVAVLLAWVGYLARLTGSLNAWQQAQETGWARGTAWPWQGLLAGWRSAQDAGSTDLVIARWADLVVTVAGLVLLAVLLARHRWPEATYVGLSVGVLVCSTLIVSAPRYALTWFPAYVVLAGLLHRPGSRWLRVALPVVCAPAMVYLAVSFARHQWVA